jgi:hypothetical protein
MPKKTKPAAKKAPIAKAAKKAPPAAAKTAAKKSAPAAKRSRSISSWFDVASHKPLIAEEARRLKTFLAAMADGVIDKDELDAQEKRLGQTMREVEPLLEPDLHAKVTRLLCELTAYDLMQVMHSLHQARPKTVFQG